MGQAKLAIIAAALASIGAASFIHMRASPQRPILAAPAVAASTRAAGSEPRVVALGPGPVRAGPPSMLHLDPHHTNRSPFGGPRSPAVAWTFDTGGPVQAAVVELDDGTIVAASLSGKVFALSPSGVVRFTVDVGDRAYATPLVLGDRTFVGSDARRLFAFDREGRPRLTLQTDADVDTAPALAPWGGFVFASGKVVYASKPDGTLLWRLQAKRKCYASPAIGDDGTSYVGSQDDHLYAISAEGTLRWRVNLGADVDSSPVILDDGTIVVGTDGGHVVALESAHGDVRWKSEVGGYVRGPLSVAREGTILASTYGPTPRVLALASERGEQRTLFTMPGVAGPEVGIHGAPVQDAAGRLYFGTQDDNVYALDSDGSVLWKLRTGGDVDAPAVITTQGLLVIGSDDGKIYAVGGP